MKKKLWSDLKTDKEKYDFLMSGEAHKTGIIAPNIVVEVASKFKKLDDLLKICKASYPNARMMEKMIDPKRSYSDGWEDAFQKIIEYLEP